MNQKKVNENDDKFSSIKKHKRLGKKLIPPLGDLNISQFVWDRDLIPEFLWIDGLTQKVGINNVHNKFYQFLDYIENYIEDEQLYLLGFISDFDKVPETIRENVNRDNKKLIEEVLLEPIGDILSLYPHCPASWLIPEEWLKEQQLDKEGILNKLKDALLRLYKAKDDYCGYIRVLPLGRILKHGKLSVSREIEHFNLFRFYPNNLNDDEKKICQSMARNIINSVIQFEIVDGNRNFNWSKYFWNKNFELSPCKYPSIDQLNNLSKTEEEYLKKINDVCQKNIDSLQEYLFEDLLKLKKDLYDPSKDEVVIGLFSRIIRIYILLLNNPHLWAIDISNIFLRCLTDTIFTLCYLLKQNDEKLYQNFIEYGRGKEKLLLLHIQDNYPDAVTTGVEDIEKLEVDLGDPFFIEFLNINIGSWIDKSARAIAFECGFAKEYRLIYNPTSEDIHGSWFSIKKANLTRCINLLHRFHRLPQNLPPPIFLNPLVLATDLINKAIQQCIKDYNFPSFSNNLNDFNEFLNKKTDSY